MRRIPPARLLFAAIVIAYPLIVYFGLERLGGRGLAICIIAIALARLLLVRRFEELRSAVPHTAVVAAMLLIFGIAAAATDSATLLLYYPIGMNVLMFAIFFTSLLFPPTIIEQLARLRTPDLPAAGVVYTRRVTMVWCAFFVFNGSMAVYTTFGSNLGFWAVYNSVISYSLMGLLFAGEYVVRRYVQRRDGMGVESRGWRSRSG